MPHVTARNWKGNEKERREKGRWKEKGWSVRKRGGRLPRALVSEGGIGPLVVIRSVFVDRGRWQEIDRTAF